MKIKRNTFSVLLAAMLMALVLDGCAGSTNTVEACVISNTQYPGKAEIADADSQEEFETDKDIFASVYFIESPKGMGYTGRWYLDGTEVKSEQKEITTDENGVIVFSLEADKVKTGTLRFEIVYGDDVLFSKELTVQ